MPAPLPPLPAEDLAHVLDRTRELWLPARGASFFITGGTGFFGSWLLESFAHANDALGLDMRAVVLTRDPASFARKAPHLAGRADLRFHRGELGTFSFPAGRFEYLVHAAAETGVWTKNESIAGLVDRFATGTQRVLDFAALAGVGRFLDISTGAVYGPQSPALTHVPEDDPGLTAPLPAGSAWAEGKRLAEGLCLAHAAQHGYSAGIARCFTFVGPHLQENFAISCFLEDALHRRPIHVTGDGTPRRSYLHAADLAIWLWTILFAGSPGRAYNVGSPHELDLATVARTVAKVVGETRPVRIAVQPATGPAPRYVPATHRAETELGLRVWIPLEDAIRKTLAWRRLARAGDLSSPKTAGSGC
jgi:nucleoside-diphosphate-sugar epimerase